MACTPGCCTFATTVATNHECQKTHRTWSKATCFGDEDFYEHNDYLAGIAYFEEYNQDVEPDTLVSA